MKAILVVSPDEADAVTYALAGETIIVSPGQAVVLDLSTGAATLSIGNPAKPADNTGVTPPELQAVTDGLAATNTAVADATAAAAAHTEATQAAATAQATVDTATQSLADAADEAAKALAQQQLDTAQAAVDSAQATADQAAADHAAALTAASAAETATHDAADTVSSLVADPSSPVTQAHSDQADQMAEAATAAVGSVPQLTASLSGGQPPAPIVTSDAVVSTDPANGATDDQPVIVTQDAEGNVQATPIVSGAVDPGTVTVALDGTPTAPGATLGDTAPAPDGTPAPADLAASDAPVTPVGAPQSDDGTATGTATKPTMQAVLQSLIDASEPGGEISVDELNAALTAAGFDAITPEQHATLTTS